MTPIKKKGLVVASGLLCFVVLTYKYRPSSTSISLQDAAHQPTASSTGPAALVYKNLSGLHSSAIKQKEKTDISKSEAKQKRLVNARLQSNFAQSSEHFKDWPSPFNKSGCPKSYNRISDKTVSIVIYLTNGLDSLPVQTFLSSVQFIKESVISGGGDRISIRNIVLVFISGSRSADTHIEHAKYITDLAGSSLSVITTFADTEWKAKLAGVQLANSEQVLILDDTVIANRGFILPLVSALEEQPHILVCPHVDSLLPVRIYTIYKDKGLHPDSQIWQERAVQAYYVAGNMSMVRYEREKIQKLPTMLASGGLNGEALAGHRTLLISLLSKMKTDDVAELSLLSYICGNGVFINKCSTVVRADNYELRAPAVKDPERLQRLYPMFDNNPNKEQLDGCRDIKHYFTEITRLFPT